MLTSICLIVLVTGLQAQQASYGAPSSSGYDASSAGYTAPEASYSAPGDSYAAGYNSYDYDGGYVATQEDGGLDRGELLQEGEVGLQVTVHQAAGHHLPALLRLHTQCIISGCKLQANFIGVGNIY